MEENGLPPRKDVLFSVLEQKNEVSSLLSRGCFDLAEVDNTTSAGSKEGGVLQPALAVSEGAPNEKFAIEEMDERIIKARFKKRNVLDPKDPTFDTVSQQNGIVAMKYGGLAFLALHSGSRQALRFFLDCH